MRSLVEGGVAEVVLVAQDLAWFGRDAGEPGSLAPLAAPARRAGGRTASRESACSTCTRRRFTTRSSARCWSCRPSSPTSISRCSTPRPGCCAGMKRWGSGERFLTMIDRIRAQEPDAAFRSSFIVGFPGEQESDHDALLEFLADARLDWAGFFAFSSEDGTAGGDDGRRGRRGPRARAAAASAPRCRTRSPTPSRLALVGETVEVLVDGTDDDGVLVGRTYREAPEIDGVVRLVEARDAAVRPPRRDRDRDRVRRRRPRSRRDRRARRRVLDREVSS